MNNYKLSNIIKKHLKKHGFKDHEIKKQKINLKYIKSLLNKYQIIEETIRWYDAYEDWSTWIDVEGLRYGWVWVDRTIKDTDKIIKDDFIENCKDFIKTCSKRNIFIAENDQVIWIVLPMRNVKECDVCLILRKNNI